MIRILPGRWTARSEKDFAPSVSGMRNCQWWMMQRWVLMIFARRRMIFEMSMRQEIGVLVGRTWFGRTIALLQYWRSFDGLEAYAKATQLNHVSAWARFNPLIGANGAVGIHYQPYLIGHGQDKDVSIYMQPTLPGDCSILIELKGKLSAAAERMRLPVSSVLQDRV